MIKAVLFDMDGVVLDTEKLYTRFWGEAVEECGFHMTEKQLLGLRSLGQEYADDYFKSILGPEASESRIRDIRRRRMKEYTDIYGIEAKPHVRETVEELHRRGIAAAIATASETARATQFLKDVGLDQEFDCILTTGMVAHGKPQPDIYLSACSQLGVNPGEAAAVEDSDNGVTSAWRAGCRVIMVPDLTQPGEELMKKIDAVAKDLPGILPYIDKWQKEK